MASEKVQSNSWQAYTTNKWVTFERYQAVGGHVASSLSCNLGFFFRGDISIICPRIATKLAITMFIGLYFQTFWLNWLNFNFFRSFEKKLGLWPENDRKNKPSLQLQQNTCVWNSTKKRTASSWRRKEIAGGRNSHQATRGHTITQAKPQPNYLNANNQ